jgi:hypothetical protein
MPAIVSGVAGQTGAAPAMIPELADGLGDVPGAHVGAGQGDGHDEEGDEDQAVAKAAEGPRLLGEAADGDDSAHGLTRRGLQGDLHRHVPIVAELDLEGLETGQGGWLKADPETLETSTPGIFAGGDVVAGPRMAIDAIADGKNAASSIDRYLSGNRSATGEAGNAEKREAGGRKT